MSRFTAPRARMSPARSAYALPLLTALLMVVVGTSDSRADIRDFPFTYDWRQAAQGEKELAYHFTYLRRGDLSQHELEFEYGVTERFSVAPYIAFEGGEARGLHFDALKLETRYQLGNYADNRVLPGLYLEYEKATDEAGELEGKLILSRYDAACGDLSLNYILTRGLGTGGETDHSYSLAYCRNAGRSGARLGVEWIQGLTTGRMNLGPTLGFRPIPELWLVTGYAFPVNGRDDNRAELRAIVEYQWF